MISTRFEVTVGADYSSDVKQVMLKTLIIKNSVLNSQVLIRFTDFGDSSQFFNNFWSEELFRVENIKSELRIKIFELFKIKQPSPTRCSLN
jgi:small-conductance mechanosensitive channel